MMPMRIVETEREGFAEPVVELWRDDEFIGMVFWDEDLAVVQIYPDDDGDVHDLDVAELQRVLDIASQIVTPDAFRDELGDIAGRMAAEVGGAAGEWAEEDPGVLALTAEFDDRVSHRDDAGGEGFFSEDAAIDLIMRCNELNLAIVEMEGFDLKLGRLIPRPNHHLLVRTSEPVEWPVFRAQANAQARDTLDAWPSRDSLVVSFVIGLSDGETVVL